MARDEARRGGDIVADTTAMTGNWYRIDILEATVFTALTASPALAVTGGIANATFPAGLTIHGGFTAFELASGAVLAYDAAATSA
jgi:hypothetical protein